jgi:hypothetical protein
MKGKKNWSRVPVGGLTPGAYKKLIVNGLAWIFYISKKI